MWKEFVNSKKFKKKIQENQKKNIQNNPKKSLKKHKYPKIFFKNLKKLKDLKKIQKIIKKDIKKLKKKKILNHFFSQKILTFKIHFFSQHKNATLLVWPIEEISL